MNISNNLQNVIHRVLILVVVVAVISPICLMTNAKLAYASTHICEAFIRSHHYCLGAPHLHAGDPVVETADGRAIEEVPQGHNGLKLKFVADISKCVGVDTTNNTVIVKDCTGSDTNWNHSILNGNSLWNIIDVNDAGMYLTGHNNLTQMVVAGFNCHNSCYQKFNN